MERPVILSAGAHTLLGVYAACSPSPRLNLEQGRGGIRAAPASTQRGR